MILGTLKTLTEQEYLDLRYEFLKEIEEGGEENLELYSDTDQLVSTGVGFNLTVRNVVEAVLQEGFDLLDSEEGGTYKQGKTEADLIDAILLITSGTHPSSELSTIQTQLDVLMVEYTTTKTEFKFEAIGTKTAKDKIKEVFNELAEYFEGELSSFLSENGYDDGTADTENNITNMTYSMERLALVSLAYGGPAKMLGKGLSGAIKDDNRVRAWFEIRYASNGDKTAGHAKRRYMESEMFGLYPSPVNFMNPQGEAQFAAYAEKIIAHFEADAYPSNPHKNNLLHMIDYEKKYGDMVEAAQANIDNIEGLSLSVTPWGQLFKPIASYLIDHYTKNEGIGLRGADYFFDGDVNLGLDTDGVIRSTISGAAGTDKNDLLIAANDEIKNTLDGGKGDDFLIGAEKDDELRGGADDDVLVGKNGADKLDGGSGHDVLHGGAGVDELTGGEGVDALYGGAGNDKYIFEGNFGRDSIKDSDGSGSIVIDGFTLSSLKQTAVDSIVYRDAANKFEVLKINNGSSTSLIITSLADKNNTITINNWTDGELGLVLSEKESQPATSGKVLIAGDSSANALYANFASSHKIEVYVPPVEINAGGGNDYLYGSYGADILNGGEGNDWINAGDVYYYAVNFPPAAGDPTRDQHGGDVIEGGEGNDVITGPAFDAVWHGGNGRDILLANTELSYFMFGPNQWGEDYFSRSIFPESNDRGVAGLKSFDYKWQDLQSYLAADFKVYQELKDGANVYSYSMWAGITPGVHSSNSAIGSGWSKAIRSVSFERKVA